MPVRACAGVCIVSLLFKLCTATKLFHKHTQKPRFSPLIYLILFCSTAEIFVLALFARFSQSQRTYWCILNSIKSEHRFLWWSASERKKYISLRFDSLPSTAYNFRFSFHAIHHKWVIIILRSKGTKHEFIRFSKIDENVHPFIECLHSILRNIIKIQHLVSIRLNQSHP